MNRTDFITKGRRRRYALHLCTFAFILISFMMCIFITFPEHSRTSGSNLRNTLTLSDDEKENVDDNNDITCSKPLYLKCINYDDLQYVHGNIIEKQFEIVSALSATTYDIAVKPPVNRTLPSHIRQEMVRLSEKP